MLFRPSTTLPYCGSQWPTLPPVVPPFQQQVIADHSHFSGAATNYQLNAQHSATQVAPQNIAKNAGSNEDDEKPAKRAPSRTARRPNWKDAETRWLIEIWSEHQPLSKRRNASQWDKISKELNEVLSKNSIATYRSGDQCKARMKYLEEQYKEVKDHNGGSGRDRDNSFEYFEDLDAVLGCKPNI